MDNAETYGSLKNKRPDLSLVQNKRILPHLTPKLKKQEMDDVFTEFYRLNKILEKNDQHTQNYVVIRLVTIIEQFFRKIVEKQIKNKKGVIPSEITINTRYLSDVQSTSKERLISSSYPFQNVADIVQIMKNFQILNVFSCKEKNCQDEFKELFKLRHDTVHTVMPLKEDIVKYYEMTECMMSHVLVKAYGDDRYFYVSKGSALFKLEKYDDAIKCYDKIIEIKPDDIDAYYNKGSALAELRHRKKAIMCFDNVLELNSDDIDAYIHKGIILAKLKRYDEAIQCFDKTIELKPDSYAAYNNKGIILAELKRYDEAIQCFDKTIELKPDSYVAYNNKRDVFRKLGRFSDARKCRNKIKELKSNDADNSK